MFIRKNILKVMATITLTASCYVPKAHSTIPTVLAAIGAGRVAYDYVQGKNHCKFLCNRATCGSPTLNASKDILDRLLGASQDPTLGSTTRNFGEFCLNSCQSEEILLFKEGEGPTEKAIQITVHRRYNDGWTIKNCAKAYEQYARDKALSLSTPHNHIYVYSQEDMTYLEKLAKDNDLLAYNAWTLKQLEHLDRVLQH